MDAHTPHPALSSPQKEFRSTPRPSISLQRKCSNYWHIQYMVGLPGWGVNIKPTDNHVGYNKPDTVWQDLAGHAMVEGARICGKCVRLLPHTKGFNEDERVEFWTQQRTKGGKGEARGRGRKRAPSPPITNDVPCPPSSSPHPCTPGGGGGGFGVLLVPSYFAISYLIAMFYICNCNLQPLFVLGCLSLPGV